jgi:hypothetical protein
MDLTVNFTALANIYCYPTPNRSAHRIYTDQMAPRVTRRVAWVESAFSRKSRGRDDEASDGDDGVHSE